MGAGSRALPSPAVLGLPWVHCWCGVVCAHCRACGQETEGPGQHLGSPNMYLCCRRSYNQSCDMDGPSSCCTLDHIPLVR